MAQIVFKNFRSTKVTSKPLCLLVLVLVVIVIMVSNLLSNDFEVGSNVMKRVETEREGYKNILIWNYPDRMESGSEIGNGPESFSKQNCEISKCAIYNRHSFVIPLEDYDAVVFNMLNLFLVNQLPTFTRRKKQRFVFLTQEPPTLMTDSQITALNNYFNWTMTYSLDSDIPITYGRIKPGPTAPTTPEEIQKLIEKTRHPGARNYAANKISPVGWMVSRCTSYSLRESYVHELGKFIPVDIYGWCGTFSCPRNRTHWISDPECYDILEAKYKFYLSFENSICTDYVTEKFFEILKYNIVPVVYGGADYTKIAPPHSYINAMDFMPEKLAEYLKLLDSNDTLYNEYFWWKDHYQVEAGIQQLARHGFCDLCKKLHTDEEEKHYPELLSQWHPARQCRMFKTWEAFPNMVAKLLDILTYIAWFLF